MDDLLFSQGFLISDMLHIHLHNLKGFRAIPVNELSLVFAAAVAQLPQFEV